MKTCRSHVGRHRRQRLILVGGNPRCGTWPASASASAATLDAANALTWPASASASTTSINTAHGQDRHRHRHRRQRDPRCGTWPASASASTTSINAAHGQHRYQHRRDHGGKPQCGACLDMASIGISIDDIRWIIHQCGVWPASASASSTR